MTINTKWNEMKYVQGPTYVELVYNKILCFREVKIGFWSENVYVKIIFGSMIDPKHYQS